MTRLSRLLCAATVCVAGGALIPRLPTALYGGTDPPRVNERFCTTMIDETIVHDKVQPSLTFLYRLCVDAQSKSWRRDDPGKVTSVRAGCARAEVSG